MALSSGYAFSAHYHVPNAVSFPGPGALPPGLGYKPFAFSTLVAGQMPPSRISSYVCPSMVVEDTATVELPDDVEVMSVPPSGSWSAAGVSLSLGYEITGPHSLVEKSSLRVEHSDMVCSVDYYASARPQFAKMESELAKQIIYK